MFTAEDAEWQDGWGEPAADWQPDEVISRTTTRPRPRVTPVTLDRRPIVQAPVKKPVQPSTRAMAEAQPRLRFDDPAPEYERRRCRSGQPSAVQRSQLSDEALEENARCWNPC